MKLAADEARAAELKGTTAVSVFTILAFIGLVSYYWHCNFGLAGTILQRVHRAATPTTLTFVFGAYLYPALTLAVYNDFVSQYNITGNETIPVDNAAPPQTVFNGSDNFFGTSLQNMCPRGASVADRVVIRVRILLLVVFAVLCDADEP